MEGWYHVSLRWYIMSLWTLVVILLMFSNYSECDCSVNNCNLLQCNGNSCFGCNYGYYLQSGSCVQCPDRCSTCTSSTQCKTCKDTYWNLVGGCSFTCSTNCTNNGCDDTTGYCYDCKPRTYGPQCGQDCNLCKDGQCNLRKCINGCKYGYHQENTDSGYSYCFKCVYNNCLTCSNGTYCTQCEQGYYRNFFRLTSGTGYMNCFQCHESCLDCTSTEHCHEDCIQHCSEPVNLGTTKSVIITTTIRSTKSTFSTSNIEPPTQTTDSIKSRESTPTEATIRSTTSKFSTSKTEPPTQTSESIKSTESTPTEELNSCQQQIKTCSESNDQNQLTFGHGLATGIGITIVLFGSGVGIALFIRRQAKEHIHAGKTSEGHHEYVNTNMTDILSVISSENNDVNKDTLTVSSDNTGVTNIESRDYVMLGDRPTHESDYTDLQNT